jgi:hypothetical protein
MLLNIQAILLMLGAQSTMIRDKKDMNEKGFSHGILSLSLKDQQVEVPLRARIGWGSPIL